MIRELKIYKAYLEVRADPKRSVTALAKKFGISRNNLYEIVRRVRYGDPARIKACTEGGRLLCVWEHKYLVRYHALPKNHKPGTMLELRSIIKGMKRDKFPIALIGRLLGKDRSTIVHHLA